mgnify:FL=1
MAGKSSKMMNYINYRMRVTIQDSRHLIGTFMAFDKHMNLVLGDCEEVRTIKKKGNKPAREERRTLGLVLLRGETIVSLAVESPPVPSKRANLQRQANQPGMVQSMSRGLPPPQQQMPPPGLAGMQGMPPRGMPPPMMQMNNFPPPGMPGMPPPNMMMMGGAPPPMMNMQQQGGAPPPMMNMQQQGPPPGMYQQGPPQQ